MGSNKIEAIIFDLGGVILDIDYNRTVWAFQDLGFERFDALYSKMRQSGLFDQLEKGEIDKSAFVESLQKEIPNRTKDEIVNAWNAIILDFPVGRLDYVQKLRSKVPCYLLSNTNEIHLAYFNQLLNRAKKLQSIHECFDQAYLSHEIHARKPEHDAWQIIIDEHGLIPQKTLFIDDSPQHIDAANQLALNTIHLTAIHDLEARLTPFLA